MQRTCPVCSSSDFTIIFHDHNRREWYVELEGDYVQCNSCRMRYLTNIPSFEEMGSKYEDIYVEPNIELLKSKLKKGAASNGKKILDIGCNHGIQLIPYYNSGWDIYGIDLNEKAIHDVKKYLPSDNFIVSTIEDSTFADASFQKIQTFHVLEHVYDPINFLKKCHDLLEKEWEIEIRIPNGGSLEMKVWGKYASQSWIPFHINMFDPKTIRQLLEQVGFSDIHVRTNPIPWWWILSCRQYKGTINTKRGVTNFSQNIIHKLLQVLMYPFLWIASLFWYGEELQIHAKK